MFNNNIIIYPFLFIYIIYLTFINVPMFINDLFNNIIFKIFVLIMIICLTIGNKDIGGHTLGIILAITYLITMLLIKEDRELFYLEDFAPRSGGMTPQQEEDEYESIMEQRDKAYLGDHQEGRREEKQEGQMFATFPSPGYYPGYNMIPSNRLRQAMHISGY